MHQTIYTAIGTQGLKLQFKYPKENILSIDMN